MLTLKSFHVFFVCVSIVLTSGFGVWGVMHGFPLLGTVSLAIAVLLVLYFAFVVATFESPS